MIKKLVLAMLFTASVGASVPAAAQVGLSINIGPPPVRYEPVPAARPGYLWTPGYWDYRRGRHVWVGGNWIRERRGYVYAQPRWVQRDGHWDLRRGTWNRGHGPRGDRDRDGVPNRHDRHPGNPHRP